MDDLKTLKQDVLAECQDDYVGLWSVVRDVRRHLPVSDAAEIQDVTLRLLTDLLGARLIAAGNPSSDGRAFKPWELQPAAAIQRIRTEWRSLGREPDIGEIVWFSSM